MISTTVDMPRGYCLPNGKCTLATIDDFPGGDVLLPITEQCMQHFKVTYAWRSMHKAIWPRRPQFFLASTKINFLVGIS